MSENRVSQLVVTRIPHLDIRFSMAWTIDTKKSLLKLAKTKFSKLTEAEQRFFQAMEDGVQVDFREGNPDIDKPDKADQWNESRHLEADRIIWLLTDQSARSFLRSSGITMLGVKIIGKLSLAFATVTVPLKIQFSCIDFVDLAYADLLLLNLGGSIIGGLLGPDASIKSLICNDGFISLGMICLDNALLEGAVDFSNAQLLANHEISFTASGAHIKGNLIFSNLLTLGLIRLMSTNINGQFIFRKGQCLTSQKQAINIAIRSDI